MLHARAGGWNTESPGFPQAVEEHHEDGKEAGRFGGSGLNNKHRAGSWVCSAHEPSCDCLSQILAEGTDFIPCLNHPKPLEVLGAAQLQTADPFPGGNSRGRRWERDF